MDTQKSIEDILSKRVLLLDGATGTELYQRGMPKAVSPEIWALQNPEIIKLIHRQYRESGADIIYTCTFGANRIKLAHYNQDNVREINSRLTLLARQAVGKKALLCGDIGPTGRFVQPFGDLDFQEAVDIFKEQAKGLIAGGVDLLVIETMMDIQEARAALIAVKELTDKFVMVTVTFERNGRTLNGTDPQAALITLQSLGADAVGCNCSCGPQDMLKLIKSMKPHAKVPLVAKPNAGIPKLVGGKTVFTMSPGEFADYGKKLVKAGVNILGGCCGTTPQHIGELKHKIHPLKPRAPLRESLSALSSSRSSIVIKRNKSFFIVGEHINPSGRQALRKELVGGKVSLIMNLAVQQKEKGATLLDVNVGVSGIDEKKAMLSAIGALSVSSELPLVIDNSNPEVIAAALRAYPGRALINSVSAEKSKMKKLLAIARKYGAMFIILPLSEKGIPRTWFEKKAIIQRVFQEAKKLGFSKDDIIVDGLVMSIASNPEYVAETLKTIAWCSRVFKSNTIIGLSNISFAMPNRQLINAAFLALAKSKGLGLAIADPAVLKLMRKNIVQKFLTKGYRDPASLSSYFLKSSPKKYQARVTVASVEKRIFQAVLEGNKDNIEKLIKEGLSQGLPAYEIIESIMIPAIIKVGDLFDQKKYFLPQLIAGAETIKSAFHCLKPYLKQDISAKKEKILILMATVQGDIHDLGKNIVTLLLQTNGFRVIDLGKDVSAARIIAAIKHYRPRVVGLSALLTTTMVRMREVITLTKNAGLKCKFIVGGAVVNLPYARLIGAAYAKDANEAVRVVRGLINSPPKD